MLRGESASGDIEVTPEMIAAGANVLAGYEPGWVKPSEILPEIYRVMAAAGLACAQKQNQQSR